MHYFIAGNFWLTVSLLVFVGKKHERSNPEMYSVLGLGSYFSSGEYTLLTIGLFALSMTYFGLHWFHQNKLSRPTGCYDGDAVDSAISSAHSPYVVWLLLLGTYAIFMLGNTALPSVFWQSGSSSWLAQVAFFCSGILVSEIAVLGGCLALSSERLSHRILVGGLLLCLISTCFLIGVQIADRSGPPVEWCLFLYGLSIAGCFIAGLPLGWLRWRYGWHIRWKHAQPNSTNRSQVSIAYMLGCMSAIAAMIALIRFVLPTSNDLNDLADVAVACSVFTVYTVFLFLPSFWFAMRSPTPYWVILPLLVVLLGGAPATMSCIKWLVGASFDNEEILFFYAYSFGFITSVCVVLMSWRRFGFVLSNDRVVERV